jgi:peptide/nickel transport system substrate-binding protein
VRRLIAIALLAVAGCTSVGAGGGGSPAPADGRHPWTHPGQLRIGIQGEINTLNPLLANNTTESNLTRLIFDPLLTADPKGNPVPVLAAAVPTSENGGISADGLTITYKLRRDVKWHDGAPFTSKDVKFSFDALMSNANNVGSRSGYVLVKDLKTPDDFTVVVHLKQRFSPFINTFFAESDSPYSIVPAHLLAALPNINAIAFNSHPVGTGPFTFKEWSHGDHITLEANPNYFLGAPKIREIVVRPIPDENTEVNELRTHEIDWQFEASPSNYCQLKTIPDLVLVLHQQNSYERIELNTKHPPLDDVRVRQAIAYAVDSKKLVNDLTCGSAVPADQDLPPFMWAHSDKIVRYPYDLAKAKALMAAAGYTPGPDGILQRNGQKLSLEITTNSTNATRRHGVVLTQAMLRLLGIDVSVKTYLPTMLFASMGQNGVLQNGRFDLAWTGWVAGVDPDNSQIYMCTAHPPDGSNDARYCNPLMDAAQKKALEEYGRPERKAAYDVIEYLETRDQPQLNIWWPRQIEPINPDFKHFQPNPVTETWNAYQWEI